MLTFLLKTALRLLFRLAYRVEVKGLEHAAAAGERAVVVANHQSFLDGPLLGAFLPGKPAFAINTHIAKRWWVRPFLWLIDAVRIDPTSPLATKHLVKAVREGRHCVIFPEGRITVTNALMKVYEGPGLIADKADAPLLPVRIEGAQWTPFSRLGGVLKRRWFPKITITILPPRRLAVDPDLRGRKRRNAMGTAMQDLMSDVAFETRQRGLTLFDALLEARAQHGGRRAIAEDAERKPIGYDRLITGSFVLGRALTRLAPEGGPVGLLLPNALGAAVAFFGLQAEGRPAAMLNFTAGAEALDASCRATGVRTVVTSRRFVAMARLEKLVEGLQAERRVIWLEDVRDGIGLLDKLRGKWLATFPGLRPRAATPEDTAAILFTSGSEGLPKGVALSHANLLANCAQLRARIDFNPRDIVFNALPMFHSFGMTGGTLLPLLSGVKTFLYPSPLHYRIVPELVYDRNATILFGTDTFLAGYARMAHAYDFHTLRYVFAGAEKVRDETRRSWMERFGVRILEGYGTTETSPVIAVNTAMHARAGTVGRLLPGLEWRLDPVDGVEEGGRLRVRGPNVMRGYLKADRPGEIQPPAEGWHDTGDIVTIDDEGFVHIRGRAKRFAKIGGEMVSLTAVEDLAAAAWPDAEHAALTVADPGRGEKIVLATTRANARREELLEAARRKGVPELAVPKAIVPIDAIPVLGTGKTDYRALQSRFAQG